MYASLFLGEVGGYYERFWWWDTLLHGASGFALGFAGFLVLYILHLDGRLNVSPTIFAIFTFCFALSVGALWEIFEFMMDTFFGLNMQRTETGVVDTMYDLIIDAFGALLASMLGYKYIKNEKTGKPPPRFFNYLITKFLSTNPNLLKSKK